MSRLIRRIVQCHVHGRIAHPEEVASDIPIDPPRPSHVAESQIDPQQLPKRASHSGPLSQRSDWVKDGKRSEDAPKISVGPPSFMSISASRRSLLSDNRSDRSGPSHPDVPKLIGRLPASFKETSESLIQQDQKHQLQNASGFQSKEDERSTKKDPVLGSKIYYSEPIVPSGNMDQMLKDHDRHIQEAFRRARIDKAKARKHKSKRIR